MDLENRISELETEIQKIKERNQRVEKDKARETSFLRKMLILGLTYIVMCIFMYSIGVAEFWINAVVPTLGFFLSTLSFSFFKKNRQKNI